MVIRAAVEADAPAIGHVTVECYLAAHRGQMPDAAWSKRAAEWTPELSARAWAATLRALAAEPASGECIYVADHGGSIVGVVMCGPADQAPAGTGEVYLQPSTFNPQLLYDMRLGVPDGLCCLAPSDV